MENLPPDLIDTPKPLVFITGYVENEPDIHDRVIKSVCMDDPKDASSIKYQSISLSHKFWEKKSPKEHPSTDGILKSHWLEKHVQQIPSVVVMITNFNVDWPAGEWIRRESYNAEVLGKLRATLNARDVKVILLAVRTGTGIIDKDIIEERTNSMKKHFGLDGRNLMVMTISDFNPLSPLVRRLAKTIREHASAYYVSQCRRLRNIERMVRPNDHILIARYNFKVAFFYEFQNQSPRALRHYKHSYAALTDMIDSTNEDMLDQVKAIAEMVNFKICNIMLSTGIAKDAGSQFRSHVSNFASAFSGRPWKHYSWVSEQHILYAELLAKHNIGPTFTDADRTYYFHNAALFALKRQSSFNAQRRASRTDESYATMLQKFQGMQLRPPKYFGSSPQLVDPVLDQVPKNTDEVRRLIRQYVIDNEAKVDHTEIILSLLRKALENVNPLHRRRRSHLRVLIAKQLMNMGSYDLASANLNPAIDFLSREKWALCAIPVLRKKMACAIYLGRPREYVPAALMLYSIAAKSHLGRHDKEELHRDVMSVITNTEKPTEEYLRRLRDSPAKKGMDDGSGGYVGLPLRPEYGAAATDGHPPEYFLPDGYVMDLAGNSSGLFDVRVRFDKKTVEVGQIVHTEITVTSLLHGPLAFSDMKVHFTDDLILHEFYHDDSLCEEEDEVPGVALLRSSIPRPRGDSIVSVEPEDHNVSGACLVFKSKRPKVFKFDLFIPESSLANASDVHVCVEKLVMTLRVALPLKTSGEEVSLEDEVSFQTAVVPDVAAYIAEELGIQNIEQAQEEIADIENDGFASMERARSYSADRGGLLDDDVMLTRSPVPPDSLDEVGDFLSAGPLGTVPSDSVAEEASRGTFGAIHEDGNTPETSQMGMQDFEGDAMSDAQSDLDSIAENDIMNDHDDEEGDDESRYVPALTSDNVDGDVDDGGAVVSECGADWGEKGREDEAGAPLTASVDNPDDHVVHGGDAPPTASTSDEGDTCVAPDDNSADIREEEHTSNDPDCESYAVDPPTGDENREETKSSSPPPQVAPIDIEDVEVGAGEAVSEAGDIRMACFEPQLIQDIILPAESPHISGGTTVPEPSYGDVDAVLFEGNTGAEPLGVSSAAAPNDPASASSPIPPLGGELSDVVKKTVGFSTPAEKASTAIDFQVMKQRGYREVTFDISALSREFCEARQAIGKTTQGNIGELSLFLGADGPKTLHITCPKPRLTLLYPPPNEHISILQGTIQRVNFIFHCREDKIVDGKIYLSSNYTDHFPSGGGDFFWYPDLNPSETASEPAHRINSVAFHPMAVNDSFQPACPLAVPYQAVNSVFTCPVFIKSDFQGEIVLRLRVEYVPKGFLKTAVSHEFTQKFTVLKPFGMNFNITSINDPHCGVEKKHGASVVLRGELVNVSASLDCVNSLGGDLEISKMQLMHKELRTTDDSAVSMYEFAEKDHTGDLLQIGVSKLPKVEQMESQVQAYVVASGGAPGVILHKGEAYVGSVDLRCKEMPEPPRNLSPLPFREVIANGVDFKPTAESASMGNVLVNWHIRDNTLLSPIDIRDFLCNKDLLQSYDFAASSQTVGSWLLPFKVDCDGDQAALCANEFSKGVNRGITRTRVCSMVFSIPEVQVIDAPFTVEIASPTIGQLGQVFHITMKVLNKLDSLEKMHVGVDLSDDFVITGGSSQIIEIAPRRDVAIALSLVPMECGQLPLPHVHITWERTRSTILEFGTFNIPRHVFVHPMGLNFE